MTCLVTEGVNHEVPYRPTGKQLGTASISPVDLLHHELHPLHFFFQHFYNFKQKRTNLQFAVVFVEQCEVHSCISHQISARAIHENYVCFCWFTFVCSERCFFMIFDYLSDFFFNQSHLPFRSVNFSLLLRPIPLKRMLPC